MNARCEATNEVGVRCLWLDHKGDFHMYADDRDRYAHHYGRLSAAVSAFLSHQPGADRDFLSRALAEAESTLTEAEPERIGVDR